MLTLLLCWYYLLSLSLAKANLSHEESLIQWYGPTLAQTTDELVSSNPHIAMENIYTAVRSFKLAAFYDSINELNSRITALLRDEVDEDFSKRWYIESSGHILGSVDKITALQNWADDVNIGTICETGFNLGYSALNFLIANPHASVVSFDIFMNRVGPYAVRSLQEMFPSRSITVISGDSTVSVPNMLKIFNLSCDLVFVDGGTPLDRAKDILNFQKTVVPRQVSEANKRHLNISVDHSSGHMILAPQRDIFVVGGDSVFRPKLIVDDMAPIEDHTSKMRQYYELEVQKGFVRTIDEYPVRYTPCTAFIYNASHPIKQYWFDTSDKECVSSWAEENGSVNRPVWKPGYFVVSEYI